MERSSSEENSIGGYSSEGDEYDEEDYEAFEDSDSDEGMKEPSFMRMTSTQIGRDYSYQSIDFNHCFNILQTKIVAVRNRFEYLNLHEGVILEYLRNYHFLVENAVEAMNDNIEKLMANQPKHYDFPDEVTCNIDLMPIEKHHTRHLGCGHVVCTGCWEMYLTQKVMDGPTCIFAKCPIDGCDYAITIELVEELCEKAISDR